MMHTITAVIDQDMTRKILHLQSLTEHQNAAVKWLKTAHDATLDGGVGYGYYLRGRPFAKYGFGWRPSYVETSGYIVETFYDIANAYNDPNANRRAEQIGRWLVTMQNTDGSFSNDSVSKSGGIVFDTGQVLFGLLRCFTETGDPTFQTAACKAAHWLAECLDEDGTWTTNTHLGIVHTYNVRVAWALLEYNEIFPDERIQSAAKQNLYWALTQQIETALFENCSFKTDNDAYTHTIAYAIRGLFEGGLLLGDDRILTAAHKAALQMSELVQTTGFIPGRVSTEGQPAASYCCLTGNCQLAIIWFKMSQYFSEPGFYETAERSLNYVLKTQNIRTKNKNICGGIKGSHPIWGGYASLAYPNWATKFFIEAILVKQSIMQP